MVRWRFILLSIVAFHFSGCRTSIPDLAASRGTSAARLAAEEHQHNAANYEAQGQWANALREWRIAQALLPGAQRPADEVERLEKKIERSSTRHYRAAVAARAAGNIQSARLAALRTLAIKPEHAEAMELLRSLEASAVWARLAAAPKVSKPLASQPPGHERGETDKRAAISSPAILDANAKEPTQGHIQGAAKASAPRWSHLRLGLDALSRNDLDKALQHFQVAKRLGEAPVDVLERHLNETRRALAERHCEAGVAMFRASRYGEAAVELRRALDYNPGHSRARLYLLSTTKLHE
jgi:tetratricopeptide (TPR) repeat protein